MQLILIWAIFRYISGSRTRVEDLASRKGGGRCYYCLLVSEEQGPAVEGASLWVLEGKSKLSSANGVATAVVRLRLL